MMLNDFAEKAVHFALEDGAQFCDVRAEVFSTKGFLLENGEIEHLSSASDSGLGIRVLTDGAWGFCSFSNPKTIDDVKNGILSSVKAAKYYASFKKQKVVLAESKAVVDQVFFKVKKKPSIEEMMKI